MLFISESHVPVSDCDPDPDPDCVHYFRIYELFNCLLHVLIIVQNDYLVANEVNLILKY